MEVQNENEIEHDFKKVCLKKINYIYKESLPYMLITSSISMCILSYMNTNCQLSPNVRDIIVNSNSTVLGNLTSDDKLNNVSKGIVVVNAVFSLVISLYGQYIKKQLKEQKSENKVLVENNNSLNEQIETITNQRGNLTNIPYGVESPYQSPSENTNYPEVV